MARRRASRGYHHGNLREAALSQAHRLLRRHGAEALSLRAVAAAVGVSPMALYNHFEDKLALLVALAEQVLGRLKAVIAEAAPPELAPRERLLRGGAAYVRFAVENREQFELAFGGVSAAYATYPSLRAAADDAFLVLRECLADCGQQRVLSVDPIAAERAIWSAAHGYATLWNSVPQLMRGTRGAVEVNARQMLEAILMGVAR